MTRKRKYVPPKRYNPAALAAKYDIVVKALERKTQVWEMEKQGIRNHFSKITNFTSHDVKNAIQNMDAVISTLDINNVTEEHIDTIKNCLTSMRISLDDFYRLSFEGKKIEFTLLELSKLVELLNKASFNDSKIKFTSSVGNETQLIFQPFHNVLQVLNNLVINSITAFNLENYDKKIQITFNIESEYVVIEVCDNANKIPEELNEKVFEIYYSTTGGSGIGLAHAKHIVEGLEGTIKLDSSDEEYCTKFVIKFPVKSND